MKAERSIINYDLEMNSLLAHEKYIARPRLSTLMNHIYIPKFKTKAFASFVYAGENSENYNDYSKFIEKSTIFGNKERSEHKYILGIETSFDESAASLVNSYGNILLEH